MPRGSDWENTYIVGRVLGVEPTPSAPRGALRFIARDGPLHGRNNTDGGGYRIVNFDDIAEVIGTIGAEQPRQTQREIRQEERAEKRAAKRVRRKGALGGRTERQPEPELEPEEEEVPLSRRRRRRRRVKAEIKPSRKARQHDQVEEEFEEIVPLSQRRKRRRRG